ncbi:5'/3'-nucleotidase SurE [Yoonia sp. R2331]|uniref:5'/3'-nucleotidase SurE n=1 Tax=Yoonia sp. R2331 TaxID=3237238 RepID=UPI0034E504DB
MRILITNDDGINAPGLATLHTIASTLAGTDGEVWTVAPAFEQSGVGHCISYTKPMMISELGPRRFAAEGSPADCVLAALYHVMPHARPDLILSGVNRGNNAADNTLYSGTIGAAMEAALQGVPAIALSQFFGPDNASLEDPFEAAAQHGADLVQTLLDRAEWGGDSYQMFYNVNFPPIPAADVKGARMVAQGLRPGAAFGMEPSTAPNGRTYLWIKGGPQHVATAPGTDVHANLDGYTSVTPMRADLTDHASLAAMQDLFA